MQILYLKDEPITEATHVLANQKGFSRFLVTGGEWVDFDNGDGAVCFPRITQTIVSRWLREVHQLHIVIEIDDKCKYFYMLWDTKKHGYRNLPMVAYATYELALEAGLQEALKLLPDANTPIHG